MRKLKLVNVLPYLGSIELCLDLLTLMDNVILAMFWLKNGIDIINRV